MSIIKRRDHYNKKAVNVNNAFLCQFESKHGTNKILVYSYLSILMDSKSIIWDYSAVCTDYSI